MPKRKGPIQYRPGRAKPYLARPMINGRQISKSFALEREAAEWISEQQAQARRGEWIDPRAGNVSLREWSERWLATRKGRPATRSQQESLLRNHILKKFGDRQLRSITRAEVEAWSTSLLDSGYASSTVRQAVLVFRMVMALAIDEGLIIKNPVSTFSAGDQEPPQHRYLTPAEVEALADSIAPEYRCVVWVGALAGLRIGEILALSPSRIKNGVIVVDRTITGTPKTKASYRKVTMPQRLIAELDLHQRLHPTGESGLLFPSRSGQVADHRWFNRRIFAPAVAASIGGVMTPHDLRHTHVSLCIDQGEDLVKISRRLGHGSIRVTVDIYGGLQPGADEKVAASLDRLWDQGAVRALRVIEGGAS